MLENLKKWLTHMNYLNTYSLKNCNSLRKRTDSYWFKSVLLELLSFQLRLFFFHKVMKLYVCSACIRFISAELLFSIFVWIFSNWQSNAFFGLFYWFVFYLLKSRVHMDTCIVFLWYRRGRYRIKLGNFISILYMNKMSIWQLYSRL